MNKITIQLIAALILSISSPLLINAQNANEERTFYGGLVLGANFTQVDGDNFAGYNKMGINAGAIVYAKLIDKLALSMELSYAQKGSKARRNAINPGNNYRIYINYAEVPILLNYFDKGKGNFGAGFSYARLFSSKEIVNFINTPGADFSKTDWNFILNGAYAVTKHWQANIRFQYSLAPIRKSTPNVFTRGQQFNNLWAVRVMYLF
jgi:hypothetical protein